MPALERVPAMFTEEWARFTESVALLDPARAAQTRRAAERAALPPGEANWISIPGWDDFIKLGPEPVTTADQWRERFAAKRENRAPALDADTVRAIDRAAVRREQFTRSITPEWQRAWGNILTAIDNVQDFTTTLSTFGRLALWAAPKVLGQAAPAVSAEAARVAGSLAFEASARAAELRRLGQLGLLERLSQQAGARSAAAVLAGRAGPLLGRVIARALPGIGLILLASDLLNLLTILGMLAVPLYGLLCTGAPAMIAAGVPSMIFKRLWCLEVWSLADRNPFSRRARLARRIRALPGLPSFGNLLEVAQTTQQLWGYGLSFGWMTGLMSEASTAAVAVSRGEAVRVNAQPFTQSWTNLYNQPLADRPAEELALLRRAGAVLWSAPLLLRHPEELADDDVLLILAAYLGAMDVVGRELREHPEWQDLFTATAGGRYLAPVALSDTTRAWADAAGLGAAPGGWALPGTPASIDGTAAMEQLARETAAAMEAWLIPRRNSMEGAFAGAAITAAAGLWQHLLAPERGAWREELVGDAVLMERLGEAGLVWSARSDADDTWRWWGDVRRAHDAGQARLYDPAWWLDFSSRYRVELMRTLPPDRAYPPEWLQEPRTTPGGAA